MTKAVQGMHYAKAVAHTNIITTTTYILNAEIVDKLPASMLSKYRFFIYLSGMKKKKPMF